MTLSDIAPTISSLGITQTQVNTYFENKIQPPAQPEAPVITKEKVISVANALYVDGIETHNGLLGLAQEVGLKVSQVKLLVKEIKALEAEWNSTQEE